MEKNTVAAVDIAESVFEVAVSHEPGRVTVRPRLRRSVFLALAQTPPATFVVAACGSAHYWAREVQKLGHHVVLLPPHHVRHYVTRMSF